MNKQKSKFICMSLIRELNEGSFVRGGFNLTLQMQHK